MIMALLINNGPRKAVAYYRHSAEDKQENSIPIQRLLTRKFAAQHNLTIIHEEVDEGKSGLQADRDGFQNLLHNWVLNPHALLFEYVLVYDVSRWGRFQDQDEAGHYEFLCRQAGRKLIYVNQGFPRHADHLVGSLRTALERYMAAEYSRQLSDKVFRGAVEVTRQGYSAGGPPPYGLARLLLNSQRQPIRLLLPGEHKQIANERVTFTPSLDNASNTVKKIFFWFVEEKLSPERICQKLNDATVPPPHSSTWNAVKITRVLTNQAYTGTLIYHKTSNKLRQGHKKNPPHQWIVVKNAFPALIGQQIFHRAQQQLQQLTPPRQINPANIIKKTKDLVSRHLDQLTKRNNQFEETKRQTIPVIFGVTRTAGKRRWCFVLPPSLRLFKKILAVGIRNHQHTRKQPASIIEELFLLPQAAFDVTTYLLISEEDKSFQQYHIDEAAFDRTARELAISHEYHAGV